jgi:hypothetical protein
MPILMTLRMRLPVCPSTRPRARDSEIRHFVEHGVHLGHDVLAVHQDGVPRARAARRAARRGSP